MLELPKSYLGIHGLRKFFIIILTTTFYSYFYRTKANKKDITSAYLFYLSVISPIKSNTIPNQNK